LTISVRYVLVFLLAAVGFAGAPALADDPDDAALSLGSAPVKSSQTGRESRLLGEGAIGIGDRRDGTGNDFLRRISIDFNYLGTITPGWRAVLSDRLDVIKPNEFGADTVTNSLREAYLSWQPDGASTVVDVGRVNLRYGPAYGYNPTDFFRDGTLRTVTSLDPLTWRENRLGTVAIHGQRLWSNGSLSLAFSPKLENEASQNGLSLDLGATNNRDRGLLVLSGRLSERLSGQVLVYKESGPQVDFGASATALVSDAVTAYVEGARGHEPDLFSRTIGALEPLTTRNRLAAGLTFTSAGKLSLTGEYQYNGFALGDAEFAALGRNSPELQTAYVQTALQRQELASRRAWMVYVTQKSLGLKNLDLTALGRFNAGDHSWLCWVELRHHWDRFDWRCSCSSKAETMTQLTARFPNGDPPG
jgi:hypothetical protein